MHQGHVGDTNRNALTFYNTSNKLIEMIYRQFLLVDLEVVGVLVSSLLQKSLPIWRQQFEQGY